MEYKYHNRMRSKIQAGLVLHDSTLTRLENLCYSLNLRGNFRFNAIWHQWSVATHTVCERLAESEVTVTPSLSYMGGLHTLHNDVASLVSSFTALAFFLPT